MDTVELIRAERHTSAASRVGTIRIRQSIRVEEVAWATLKPHQRYVQRVRAAAVALDDPLLAFESAAVQHGLPVFDEPRYVHVFVTGAAHSYRQGDVQSHTGVDGREEVRIGGVRVTSLVDTIIDLIRVLPLAHAVAVIDAGLRLGAELTALEDHLRSQRNHRGRTRAWEALRRADGRSESVLESISRVVIDLLGFEPPELQREFWIDGHQRRPDFFWATSRISGDADGDEKYFLGDEDETRRRVRDQRRRDIELQHVADRILHWEWRDAVTPALLEQILVDAGVPRIRPADPRLRAALDNRSRTILRRPRPAPSR